MPKINAATLAEHRAEQHRAILQAAARLVDESGGQVPTLVAVATEVGLARSSLYQYVASSTDLIVQLLLQVIPEWTDSLRQAMDRAGTDPAARLGVYVDHTFRLFVDGIHGPLMIAAGTVPAAFADEKVQRAHNALLPEMHALLETAGGPGSALALPLLDAAIQRGADLVAHGSADRARTLLALQRMAAGLTNPDAGPAGLDR